MKILSDLIKKSSLKEIMWINGYISGIISKLIEEKEFINKENNDVITLVYSSETGNAKNLALNIYKKINEEKLKIKLLNLEDYCLFNLEKESYLLIVISTHGNGEPPNSGKDFFNFIHNKNIRIKNLKYSVLALGDKSYDTFCKAGDDIDQRLKLIGGDRILKIQKCDVFYKKESEKWINNIINFFREKNHKSKKLNFNIKKKENLGIIDKNILLNNNKNKNVYHIEILIPKNIQYSPGDAIGIYPENDSNIINKIMKLLNLNIKKNFDIFHKLKNKDIYNIPIKYLKNKSITFGIKNLDQLDIFTIIKNFYSLNKEKFFIENFIEIMNPIKPRLYSISSSLKKHVDKIHITVLLNKYKYNDKIKYGYCSNFLSKLKKGDKINFFIYKNNFFKLPDPDKDIILIGPGTGIAPFRAFLYERESINASGKNWLFFGNQYYSRDFLYKSEIENWKKNGLLYHVHLAFSRDQKNKIYIQDKIWENRKEFFYWIKNGAYIYICGKKTPMSINVEKIIYRIVENLGKENPESFISKMKKNKRYLKDVY
ncbi:diflavin oxidoreductase [Blattabacterium cuenoti]|uniref:diflavin oxidoreductase n=1 Tax=Blattabacterium cuenoti TaxID=1653831 RepID=UPI001EEBC609|nr:flavodoxin domain-containing protein [Blattabacterium cuenoti]